VLDLGCGPGIPITKVLLDEGFFVSAIDASPSMVAAFEANFPGVTVTCDSVEASNFYNEKFQAIVAWGLIFLLRPADQADLIAKIARALHIGGRFLITAPAEEVTWQDNMTGLDSYSLGAKGYHHLMNTNGLVVASEYKDEGGNNYYDGYKALDR
jgi:SAM-dependent methyltransferase